MLTGLTAVLGAVGWALWYICRQDGRKARQDAQEATSRARLADAQASAAIAERAAMMCAAMAAEAQVRVASAENTALRRALADARASQHSPAEKKADDFYDSSTGKFQAYRVRKADED